jgi:acetyl-CoA carboxylase carboxyl transferase subunit alpha
MTASARVPLGNPNYLDFEQPIAQLEAQIAELRANGGDTVATDATIAGLNAKIAAKTRDIFATLGPWQASQLARHPLRPHALDLIPLIFSEFHELAGDRSFSDDAAIVGGLARIDGQAVVVLGQQKGRDTKQKVKRNFAMPRPEGYRKALRLMQLAERFKLPLLTLIDTPGAYPGIGAEERNQSEAIARNLLVLSELNVPIIATVIGEGGSGGALAIGVGDVTLMLQYSTYSVISPEGCASILWKSAEHAREAAEAMGITSERLKSLGLIDEIVPEPLGGAHRNVEATAKTLKAHLLAQLNLLNALTDEARAERRYARLRGYGAAKAA